MSATFNKGETLRNNQKHLNSSTRLRAKVGVNIDSETVFHTHLSNESEIAIKFQVEKGGIYSPRLAQYMLRIKMRVVNLKKGY